MVWRAKERLRVAGMSHAGGATRTSRPAGMAALADRQALLGPLDEVRFEKIATTKGA